MCSAILFVVFGFGLRDETINRFGLLEINTVQGQFTQAIWWDWDPVYRRHHCQGWSIDFELLSESPPRIRARGVVITAPILRYSVTAGDPERENRRLFPECWRRELIGK